MKPQFEDLQDNLIEWLRPMRARILTISEDEFEHMLEPELDRITPHDPGFCLIVALDNPVLRQIKLNEGYFDVADIIRDNIYSSLYKFAWQWYREIRADMEQINGTV